MIVVALGAVPNIEWLEGSGLTLDRGVVCDANLQAAPHVFAAGDVVTWPHPMADGELIRIEHWTNAAEQGTHAGRNALSAETRSPTRPSRTSGPTSTTSRSRPPASRPAHNGSK